MWLDCLFFSKALKIQRKKNTQFILFETWQEKRFEVGSKEVGSDGSERFVWDYHTIRMYILICIIMH